MKIAIMQPYILPYIGYFQLIKAVDKFIIYDDVNFINRGWINRNRLLVGGKDSLFTIPLKEASQNKLIHEIEVNWDAAWKSKFLKTLEQSYKKAPFYADVLPLVQASLALDNVPISEVIVENLRILCSYLDIKTEIIASSRSYNNQHLKAQERILDICLQEKAHQYINPIGGIELYDKTVFEEKGMVLNFIKAKAISYPQFKNEFVPWLSILDVLMFNSVAQIQGFLEEYELV
ncbi:MAG: WbqC family protein [Flectobacillus sp.]|nr:WbqC family protein [Flectobacillus sp.]